MRGAGPLATGGVTNTVMARQTTPWAGRASATLVRAAPC